MQAAQHLGGQAHHARGLGDTFGQARMEINTMIHRHMPHVLNTTNDEYIALANHDGAGCMMQCIHGRTTEAVDGGGGYLSG